MLDRLFSKALSLVINGEEISFHTLAEFEFALGGRTNVPASKLADLIMLSPDELKREAQSIKSMETRFVDLLSRSLERRDLAIVIEVETDEVELFIRLRGAGWVGRC